MMVKGTRLMRIDWSSGSAAPKSCFATVAPISATLAAPALRGSAQVIWGNSNWSTQVFGVTPEYLDVRQWPLASGRSFEAGEMAGAAKVCLIGATVAKQLFGAADPLDQSIRIKRIPFTVIGVLDVKGQSMMGTDRDDLFLVPIKSARSRVLGTASAARNRTVGTIWVKAADGLDTRWSRSRCARSCASATACRRAPTTISRCATCRR